MKYKNIFVIILLSFFTTINLHAQETEEIKIPLSNPNARAMLDVEIRTGPITVIGTARKDILIKYSPLGKSKKHKSKNKSKSKDGLKKITNASIDLEISESDNRVKVRSESWNQGIILEIEVPKDIDLKIDTYNHGDIEIDNISGSLELTSYNGPITATKISGSVLADTYNGKILATFDKVTPDEPMAFTNYNGGLDLTFPTDLKATFKISNKRGDIYTGYDMVMSKQKIEKEENPGSYRIQLGKWITGSINGGGAEITLENHNGDVYIRKATQE